MIKQGSGALALTETGGDSFSGGITLGGGTLILSNTSVGIAGGITITNGTLTDAHGGTISGGLTVTNGSALLDGTGTISGNASIASGATIQVGNNDANGSLPSGSVTDNGVLMFSQTADVTVANVISGTGSLSKNNNNVLILSALNSFSGGAAINAGKLQVTGGGGNTGLGGGNTTVNAGGTLIGGGGMPSVMRRIPRRGRLSLTVAPSAIWELPAIGLRCRT